MRLLHRQFLVLLIISVPVSAIIECIHYRVPLGDVIPKAIRNPKCSSKAEYCVKITGNTSDGKHPFIAGRCEYPGECKENADHCFTRTDEAGKTEEVCCSSDNFSNHGSSNSVIALIALCIILILSVF